MQRFQIVSILIYSFFLLPLVTNAEDAYTYREEDAHHNRVVFDGIAGSGSTSSNDQTAGGQFYSTYFPSLVIQSQCRAVTCITHEDCSDDGCGGFFCFHCPSCDPDVTVGFCIWDPFSKVVECPERNCPENVAPMEAEASINAINDYISDLTVTDSANNKTSDGQDHEAKSDKKKARKFGPYTTKTKKEGATESRDTKNTRVESEAANPPKSLNQTKAKEGVGQDASPVPYNKGEPNTSDESSNIPATAYTLPAQPTQPSVGSSTGSTSQATPATTYETPSMRWESSFSGLRQSPSNNTAGTAP